MRLLTAQTEHAIHQEFIFVFSVASSFTFTWIGWSVQKAAHLPLPWSSKNMHLQLFSLSPASSLPRRSSSLSLSLFCPSCPSKTLCFDIHVAAWLRCKSDTCKVPGHPSPVLSFFFTSCTFHPPLFHPTLALVHPLQACITEFVPALQHVFFYSHSHHPF